MFRIGFGTPEDGEDGVADKLIDGAIVLENFRTENLEVVVEHIDDDSGIEGCAGFCEAAEIGEQDGHVGFLASGLEFSFARFLEESVAYLW